MSQFDEQGLPVREGEIPFITKEQVNENQHASIAKERAWKEFMPFFCRGTSDDNVAHGARERITAMIEAQEARLDATIGLCESPIERLMMISLAYMPVLDGAGYLPSICDILHDPFMDTEKLCVTPQFSLGRYRMDFYIQWDWRPETGGAKRACIECDGKEFHGADQWTTDKVRDGFLASFGVRTFRISGREIYKSEGLCANPIFHFVHGDISSKDIEEL